MIYFPQFESLNILSILLVFYIHGCDSLCVYVDEKYDLDGSHVWFNFDIRAS